MTVEFKSVFLYLSDGVLLALLVAGFCAFVSGLAALCGRRVVVGVGREFLVRFIASQILVAVFAALLFEAVMQVNGQDKVLASGGAVVWDTAAEACGAGLIVWGLYMLVRRVARTVGLVKVSGGDGA